MQTEELPKVVMDHGCKQCVVCRLQAHMHVLVLSQILNGIHSMGVAHARPLNSVPSP